MQPSHDSETLAEGQQVIVACAFLWHEFDGVKKVFLPKRADTKKFLPGVYELPGGHIDFGENITEGLRREILEEIGMNVVVGAPYYVYDYKNLLKKSHSVEIVYFAKFVGDIGNITLGPSDHSGYEWFDEQQVRTIVAKNREGLQNADTFEASDTIDHELRAILRGFELLRVVPGLYSEDKR